MLVAIAWTFVLGCIGFGFLMMAGGASNDDDEAMGCGCLVLLFGIACVVAYCLI